MYFGHALFQFFGHRGQGFSPKPIYILGNFEGLDMQVFCYFENLATFSANNKLRQLEINFRNVMFSTGQLITYDFVNPPFKTKHLKCLVSGYI